MDLNTGGRTLRLFSSAIIDQVVLSAGNFLVGFLLIRYTSDQGYGTYVLVQSALMLVVSSHSAWLMAPLAILTPRLKPDEREQTIASVKHAQRRVLRIVAAALVALTVIGYWSGLLSEMLASVIAAGIIAGWTALRRDFLRSILLIYSRPHSLLGADTVYVVSLLLGVICAVFIGGQVATICALAFAAWAGAAAAHRSLSSDPGWAPVGPVSIWPQVRSLGFWSLIGCAIYWCLAQSYSYLLATRLDLKAVADVNAIRMLMSPAFILIIGLQSLLGPTAAKWYVQIGIHRLARRLMMILIGVGLALVLYVVVIWIGRDWLVNSVLHKHIQDRDSLLLLWGGVALISLCREILQCALISMGQLKSLAWRVGVSAAVTVSVMWFGLKWWGAPGAPIGQIVGEVIYLVSIIGMLRKSVRHAPVAVETADASP